MKSDSKQRSVSKTEHLGNPSADASDKGRNLSGRSGSLFQRGISELLILFILVMLAFPACCTRYVAPSPEEQPDIVPDEPPKDIPQIGGSIDDTIDDSVDSSIGGKISDEPVQKQGRDPRLSSPVVASLIHSANRQMKSGQLDRAFSTAERALRIDSSNPNLWNLMARIQLKRGNIQQAEQLARKSNLLSRGNKALQSDNWRIIAESLKRRGATAEAEKAEAKANELK